ncbi:MAG TPA: hypothetical protein VEL28_09130 [Candidatus Binatia bacterium]|nr:hypothetical protein [Candidatus Binatia bacterium]
MKRHIPMTGAARSLVMAAMMAGACVLPAPAEADSLTCRKVVADFASGEGRNAAEASRVKCAEGEMLTGGTCYAETRPEEDKSCQTSAMGIIQIIAEHPESTEGAFFTCLQTGGTDCPVAARTRAMGICCKIVPGPAAPAAKP